MKLRHGAIVVVLLVFFASSYAQTQQRLIVRDTLGLSGITKTCLIVGCQVMRGLGDPLGQVFLVSVPNVSGEAKLIALVPLNAGVVNVELDQIISLTSPLLGPIPSSLSDSVPVNYYGTVVWHGYLTQPANKIIRTSQTQATFHQSGAGIVAVIDTGVDTTHPALSPVLVPGYDFTRNQPGADEKGDVNHSTAAVLDGGGGQPELVNPSLAAFIPSSAAALLSNPQYSGFGHGTMTAGLIHLVAPTARIMPLKAFNVDGTGYYSDVIRAVYYAAGHKTKVISMSFSFSAYSTELAKSLNYANGVGVISVASAGNDGKQIKVYPASLGAVMGVGSTSNNDIPSSFSNYGSQVVWVAAPGEDVMSTYPFSTYATSSGTSFSTPLVSGTAGLLVGVSGQVNQASAAKAVAHAQWIGTQMNKGRLDTYQATQAFVSCVKRNICQ